MEDWIHAKHPPVGPDCRDIPLGEVTWCCRCGSSSSVKDLDIFCHRCTLKFCRDCASTQGKAADRPYLKDSELVEHNLEYGVCHGCNPPECVKTVKTSANEGLYQLLSAQNLPLLRHMAGQQDEFDDASSVHTNNSFVCVDRASIKEEAPPEVTPNDGAASVMWPTKKEKEKKKEKEEARSKDSESHTAASRIGTSLWGRGEKETCGAAGADGHEDHTCVHGRKTVDDPVTTTTALGKEGAPANRSTSSSSGALSGMRSSSRGLEATTAGGGGGAGTPSLAHIVEEESNVSSRHTSQGGGSDQDARRKAFGEQVKELGDSRESMGTIVSTYEMLVAKSILDQMDRRKRKLWPYSIREKRELEPHFPSLLEEDSRWATQWLRVGVDWADKAEATKGVEILRKTAEEDFDIHVNDVLCFLRLLSRVYQKHARNMYFEGNFDKCLRLCVQKLRTCNIYNWHVELVLESIGTIIQVKNYTNEIIFELFYILVDKVDAEVIVWGLKHFKTEWARDLRNRLFEHKPECEILLLRQDEFIEGRGAFVGMEYQMTEKQLAGRTFPFMGKTVTKIREIASDTNSKSKAKIYDLGGIHILKKIDHGMAIEQLVQRTMCCMEDIVLSNEQVKKLASKHKIDLKDVRTTYSIFTTDGGKGFIERKKARTLAHIKAYGGVGTYINETRDSKRSMQNLAWTFATSTLFAFVLRLGDRHNENLMVTNKGVLFHIDFGYCLDREPMDSKMVLAAVSLGTEGRLPKNQGGAIMRLDYGEIYNAVGTWYFEKLFWPLARAAFHALRKHAPILVEYVALIYSREDSSLSQDVCIEKATRFVLKTLQPVMDDANATRFLEHSFRAAMDSDQITMRDQLHDLRIGTLQTLPQAVQRSVATSVNQITSLPSKVWGSVSNQRNSSEQRGWQSDWTGRLSSAYNKILGGGSDQK